MLEVIEVREGNFEFSDIFSYEDRKRNVLYKQLYQLSIAIGIILFIVTIVMVDSTFIKFFLAFFSLALIGVPGYMIFEIIQKMTDDIVGFVIIFDEAKTLEHIHVRRWLKGKLDGYTEEEIRFNQAIGFQALMDDEGEFIVEIIVDANFPGTSVFKTYDLSSLAEFILLFQKIAPDMDKWYYKTMDGKEWENEIKVELNNEIETSRIPWLIRKYYGF